MSTKQPEVSSAELRNNVNRVDRILQERYGDPVPPSPMPPLEQLIATVLSQNTSDTNSRRAFESLRAAFPSWHDVASAPTNAVEDALRPGGLARVKARRIQAILTGLDSEGDLSLDCLRSLPDDAAERELLALDGVGWKTARCVLLFSLGRDAFPIDTHVLRTLKRLGIIPAAMSADKAHGHVPPLIPRGRAYALHVNLIRLGRETCRPTRPECRACPLESPCLYARKGAP